MTSRFTGAKYKPDWLRPVPVAIAGLAAVIAADDRADAANLHGRAPAKVEFRTDSDSVEPIMAVVSLRNQQITVYDAKGWVMRAPVSTGQKGRETPAGVFSVIEKQAEHYSNLYDDAYMPNMQRLTWSGIALHGGPLPGYRASHGCIRLPYDFARRLFDVTRLGMRVIVAPGDAAPIEIVHPPLFPMQPRAGTAAADRAAETDEAARKVDEARAGVVAASGEVARATISIAEDLKLRAEAQLAALAGALPGAAQAEEPSEDSKANAAATTADIEAQWAAAKAKLQPKFDAVSSAREVVVMAEKARVVAAEEEHKAALSVEPVSVFISRKAQRLYVRLGFQSVLESPVTIRDADRPIGTHVFTAVERIGHGTDIRWSVVSLNGGRVAAGADNPHGRPHGGRGQHQRISSVVAAPTATDPDGPKAALDRIEMPQDVLDRIAEISSPRSSLIISDEELGPETGKDMEFAVVMSDEPHGGIAFRHVTRVSRRR